MESSRRLDDVLVLVFPSVLPSPTNKSMNLVLNFYFSEAECQCHLCKDPINILNFQNMVLVFWMLAVSNGQKFWFHPCWNMRKVSFAQWPLSSILERSLSNTNYILILLSHRGLASGRTWIRKVSWLWIRIQTAMHNLLHVTEKLKTIIYKSYSGNGEHVIFYD